MSLTNNSSEICLYLKLKLYDIFQSEGLGSPDTYTSDSQPVIETKAASPSGTVAPEKVKDGPAASAQHVFDGDFYNDRTSSFDCAPAPRDVSATDDEQDLGVFCQTSTPM